MLSIFHYLEPGLVEVEDPGRYTVVSRLIGYRLRLEVERSQSRPFLPHKYVTRHKTAASFSSFNLRFSWVRPPYFCPPPRLHFRLRSDEISMLYELQKSRSVSHNFSEAKCYIFLCI